MFCIYLIKLLRILAGILILSYILGCVWYVYCQIFFDAKGYIKSAFPSTTDDDYFVKQYNLDNN
jgi:hypothetical protein